MIGKKHNLFSLCYYNYSRWDKKWLDRIIIVILEWNIQWKELFIDLYKLI